MNEWTRRVNDAPCRLGGLPFGETLGTAEDRP
jgi:hypothetical protein